MAYRKDNDWPRVETWRWHRAPRPLSTYRGAIRNKQFGRKPRGQGNTTPQERAAIRGEA